MLLRLVAWLITGYLTLCGLLYLLQDRLIFLPRPLQHPPAGEHVRPAAVTRDGITLRGWIVNPEASGPLLVYFGGNAEELSGLVDVFRPLAATTVLINYRGYGESSGAPSAAALLADARHVVRVMSRRLGPERRLILFGRSVGAGVAVRAAGAAGVDGIILMSPYRSLAGLAQRIMPVVPVRLLLRRDIDAAGAVDSLPPRVLILYGARDHIIPAEESLAFAHLLNPAPRLAAFRAGHNVPLTHPDIWPHVEAFVIGG